MEKPPLLSVRNLRLDIPVSGKWLHAVRGVDLDVQKGRTLGIVGESGSGKSLTALSVLGLQPASARRHADAILLDGEDIGSLSETALARNVRGRATGMIFQEPMTSLNPVMTVGRQLTEVLTAHGLAGEAEARARAVELLERVGITGAARRIHHYPHQFSGGQRQRVMIALALMARPKLLIADEPTTALDVTVQAEILRLLGELRDELGMGMILITHNLGVVSRVTDDIAVMYAGEVVEYAPVHDVFSKPRHPYTRGLLSAAPGASTGRGSRLGAIPGVVPSLMALPRGCAFASRCDVAQPACETAPPPLKRPDPASSYRCIHDDLPPVTVAPDNLDPGSSSSPPLECILEARALERVYTLRQGLFAPAVRLRAVAGVDLKVQRGEILAIVGESGCGKSTLGRLLLGLEKPDAGEVLINGRDISAIPAMERARSIQPVFQDPRGSLNPRRSVGEIIRRPLDIHRSGTPETRDMTVRTLMQQAGLPARLMHAYPGQLSGGQRQRVAIARALIMQPQVLLCDEPTSALDVSVQAQILNLLTGLKHTLGLTLVLITHDLAVVEHIADRVAVMYLGQIVEQGAVPDIFANPQHPYTRALMQSALPLDPAQGIPEARIGEGFPNPLNVPRGCVFSQRCLDVLADCADIPPSRHPTGDKGAFAACHLLRKVERVCDHVSA